jgi:hypothetical protein
VVVVVVAVAGVVAVAVAGVVVDGVGVGVVGVVVVIARSATPERLALMARTFARVSCDVWDAPVWLALSPAGKAMLVAFQSQRDITPAGLLPLTPRRWAGWGVGDPETVLAELVAAGVVEVDEDTAEVFVVGFMAADGRSDNPKLWASVHKSLVDIRSPGLRRSAEAVCNNVTPGGRANGSQSDADQSGIGSAIDPLKPSPEARSLSQKPEACLPALYDAVTPAIAEAIEIVIAHRETETRPRHPERWRQAVRARLLDEYHTALVDCSDGGDARQVAVRVFGLSAGDVLAASVRLRESGSVLAQDDPGVPIDQTGCDRGCTERTKMDQGTVGFPAVGVRP